MPWEKAKAEGSGKEMNIGKYDKYRDQGQREKERGFRTWWVHGK